MMQNFDLFTHIIIIILFSSMVGALIFIIVLAIKLSPPVSVELDRDPIYPPTFGWRYWHWDPYAKVLISPQLGTPWYDSELRCDDWDTSTVVRGTAGIHAHFVPKNWTEKKLAEVGSFWPSGIASAPSVTVLVNTMGGGGSGSGGGTFVGGGGGGALATVAGAGGSGGAVRYAGTSVNYTIYQNMLQPFQQSFPAAIHGIVERFGHYVLGTDGWRAEHVFIRKLFAPTTEIGLQLEAAYPDVEVVYADKES